MLVFTLGFSVQAWSLPPVISSPKPLGTAQFTFFGATLYSATLYTENGKAYSSSAPFILELTYKRSISAQNLIKATLSEMKRMGNLNDQKNVETSLSKCFRNVKNGDRFAAVNVNASTIDFYFNDQKTCTFNQSNISKAFFDIWLSSNSRSPAQSAILIGNK